jgi:hypothetical protein
MLSRPQSVGVAAIFPVMPAFSCDWVPRLWVLAWAHSAPVTPAAKAVTLPPQTPL